MWYMGKSYVTRLATPFFSRLFASGIFREWKLGNRLRDLARVRAGVGRGGEQSSLLLLPQNYF
jgi:hypothetical protein